MELVPELARCVRFLGKEIKKVTIVQGVLEIHPTIGINDTKFDIKLQLLIVGNITKCCWKVLNTHECRAKYS